MSVATEITRIQNAKTALKTSINAKTDSNHQITNETIDDYSDFVDSIQTGSTPNLQSKSVTIQTNTTTNISADSGYDGLSSVEVVTNVSGGDTPTVGVIFSDWDTSGYPHTAQYVGRDVVGSYYFVTQNGTLGLSYKLETITLPTTLTTVNNYAFANLKNLRNMNLADTQITTINSYSFYSCNNLLISELPSTLVTIASYGLCACYAMTIKTLPSGVTSLVASSFRDCRGIVQLSMPGIQTDRKSVV